MNETLRQIEAQIEQDKNDKINEVNNEKKRYEQLMTKAQNLKCECDPDLLYYQKCERCKTIKEADNIKVHIYESPLPTRRESALAVIFELQMPTEIRCYRDILWQFINRTNPQPSNNMYEWLDIRPHSTKLRSFYKDSYNCKVKLVSSTKSTTQSHYSAPRHVNTTPLEEYFYENSLQVQIYPTKLMSFQDERRTVTPELTDPNYKDLQFSLDSTQFMQNRVIADLSKCSLQLKPTEFTEFGSFRSGHCLQWWNLLTLLKSESLSMDEESVAILIHHKLLQNGPLTSNSKRLICLWCPESHQQLLEDHFVDELILRLDRHLKDCQSNWENELILVIMTVIVMRIFTICNITRKNSIRNLVFKCRSTAQKWIELISESIQNPLASDCDKSDALRDKIVVIDSACLLTFSVYTERNDNLELSNQDIVSIKNKYDYPG